MRANHIWLSERDSLRILELLKSPPAPNAKLLAAARVLPEAEVTVRATGE